MKQTKHTVTAHGEVEYETVECASCEQEYLPEDTQTLYLGDIETRHENYAARNTKYQFKSEPREIVFCENCVKEPQKISIKSFAVANAVGILLGVIIGLIVVGIFLL